MQSFKRRIVLNQTIFAFLLILSCLIILFFSMSCNKYNEEKVELQKIADELHSILKNYSSLEDVISSESAMEINKNINLSYSEYGLKHSYALLSSNGKVQYQYPINSKHYKLIKEKAPKLQAGFNFIIHHYDEWIFYEIIKYKDYKLLVTCEHKLVFVRELIFIFIFSSPIVFLFCYIFSNLQAKRFLIPITAIDDAVKNIALGKLQARITGYVYKDEMGDLIGTLNSTFGELEKSITNIRQFSSDVAHELRTPLTAILGNLEVALSRERKNSDYQKILASAIEEMMGLKKIINTLLILSRPYEFFVQQFKTLDFRHVVDNSIEFITYIADEKNIQIEKSLPKSIQLYCIPSLLERALINLLHNAVKFSPEASVIKLQITEAEQEFLIQVTDSGCGIAKEEQAKIFDRFYQNDQSRHLGCGLGLALVQWIADLHKGTISVKSVLNEGATFILALPKKGDHINKS